MTDYQWWIINDGIINDGIELIQPQIINNGLLMIRYQWWIVNDRIINDGFININGYLSMKKYGLFMIDY